MIYSLPRRAVAEAFGTAILCTVGPGSVVAARSLLGQTRLGFEEGDLLGVAFAFGLTVAVLVYSLGKVSGCHINPAVSIALAATRRFPYSEVPVYWAAQLIGCVAGALAVWAVFGHDAITLGMGQTHIAAAAGAADYARAALAEAIGTGLLVLAILGITDSRSPQELTGMVIGMALASIILVFGPATGASLNPARAFGPELVEGLGGGTTYWAQLIPIYVVPGLVGAAAAAFAYDLLAHPRHAQMPIQAAVSREEPEV
jgi:glycerol uptake facilitator protein